MKSFAAEGGKQTLLHYVLVLAVAIVGKWAYRYASARIKCAYHLYVFRVHKAHKVFHNYVHAILVKVTMIAEAEQIKLQTLALHHSHTRNVVDGDASKVGLAGLRAPRRELRAVECHNVFVVLMLVDKGLKHVRSVVVTVVRSLVSQKRRPAVPVRFST